jgi:hypothetical protein
LTAASISQESASRARLVPATLVGMTMTRNITLADVLIPSSQAPAAEHAEALRLYGQFVGSWNVEFIDYLPDGTQQRGRGEWHWGCILDGRAIQDVWIAPPRAERPAALETAFKNRFGSTVRSYDVKRQIWYITWNNPPTGEHIDLIGRADGADILQEGQLPDGTRKRWRFLDITDRSFRWEGAASTDEGRTWRVEQEMWASRAG